MQNQGSRVSIVVPSLDHGGFIEATLVSLFNQKGIHPRELEVIVIDGGSKDHTLEILHRWDRKISYWVSEPDLGQTDALIKGFARATGDIRGWLCSDDLMEPDTIRNVLDFFAARPDVEFVYGDALWISRDGAAIRPRKEIPFNWFIWLHDHNYIPQPAAFWRRGLYERTGGLDPNFHVAMDGDLFARFAVATKPVHMPQLWARIRHYPEQKNNRLREQSDQEDRLVRERLGVSFDSELQVRIRFLAAKMLRVGWKLSLGAYFG